MGNRIGRTLKVDATATKQTKGKYACLYVEIDLNKVLLSEYAIRGKTYKIEYESIHIVYFFCGKYRLYREGCVDKAKKEERRMMEEAGKENAGNREPLEQNLMYGEWMIA